MASEHDRRKTPPLMGDEKRELENLWDSFVIEPLGKQLQIFVATSRKRHCRHVDEDVVEAVRAKNPKAAVVKAIRYVYGEKL